MSTPAQFTVDLTALQAKLGDRSDRFVQGFSQTLFTEVQSGGKYSPGTPVDTGFARASWDGGVMATAKAGDTIVLSNPAPYIRRLEYGWSQQAPQGFVRLALAAVQQIADEVAGFLARGAGGRAG